MILGVSFSKPDSTVKEKFDRDYKKIKIKIQFTRTRKINDDRKC